MAIRLLRELNWYGLAMVEFKVDPRDGVPKLMEINPKLWGSLNLAIASGVDFPALLYRLAVDGDVRPVFDYQVGVRCRFLLADSLHFLANPHRFRLKPSFFNSATRRPMVTYGILMIHSLRSASDSCSSGEVGNLLFSGTSLSAPSQLLAPSERRQKSNVNTIRLVLRELHKP